MGGMFTKLQEKVKSESLADSQGPAPQPSPQKTEWKEKLGMRLNVNLKKLREGLDSKLTPASPVLKENAAPQPIPKVKDLNRALGRDIRARLNGSAESRGAQPLPKHPSVRVPRGHGWLALDIADQNLRFAYLVKKGKGYEMVRNGTSDVAVNWNVPGSLFAGINDILKDPVIRPKEICVSISRADTVIHQLALPAMNNREMLEVIKGEIEKIPKFSVQKFDYILDNVALPSGKRRVVYAGVTQDILDFVFHEVTKTEIPFHHLELTPLNLKEAAHAINPSKDQEAILMVHDQYSYLLICQNRRYVFVYKSFMGLDQVKANVNAETNEFLLSNWLSEIQRVIKSYVLKNRSAHVDKVWLLWDKERLPLLDQILEKRMETKIQALTIEQIKHFTLAGNVISNPIHLLPLVPLICETHDIKPHFPFAYFFRTFQVQQYMAKMVVASLLAALVLGGIFLHYNNRLWRRSAQVQHQTVKIKQETLQLKQSTVPLFQQYQDYLKMRERLLAQATFVKNLNRVSWAQVFSEMAQELPEEMALTNFSFSDTGRAQIKGEALSMNSIANLMRRIDKSVILQEPKFNFLKEKNFEENKIYDFGIYAVLKQEKNEPKDEVPNADKVQN